RWTAHHLDRGHDPQGHRAPGHAVHRGHRDRDHAPDAAGRPQQAGHPGRPRGGVRLHEDNHPSRGPQFPRSRSISHHRTSRHSCPGSPSYRSHGGAGITADLAPQSAIDRIAALALEEDGARDITSELTVSPALKGFGVIEYRSGGTLAGKEYATAVARDCGCDIEWNARNGETVRTGSTIGLLR